MTEALLKPFSAWAGPRAPRVLFIGEAFGGNEAQTRKPFVGNAGREFWRILSESQTDAARPLFGPGLEAMRYDSAWIGARGPCMEELQFSFTNVFNLQPPGNKIEELCGPKTAVGGKNYPLTMLRQGKYIRPEFFPHLERLEVEVRASAPNLIVACGNTALWAATGSSAIGSQRGTILESKWGIKLLPIYHPANILRDWANRPITVVDLMKAWREAESPDIARPARRLLIDPTLEELSEGIARLRQIHRATGAPVAADIETFAKQITCISLACGPEWGLVVPFLDAAKPGNSYWASAGAEAAAWELIGGLIEDSEIPILGQNFVYDLQYLCKMGLKPKNCTEDTMLKHHARHPEMQKGLGFLGSIYTSEPAWKLMRKAKADTIKRDE